MRPIGPLLADGPHLVLAGRDDDYSVTRDAGSFSNCLSVGADGSIGAPVPLAMISSAIA